MATLLWPGREFRISHMEMIKGIKKCKSGNKLKTRVGLKRNMYEWSLKYLLILDMTRALHGILMRQNIYDLYKNILICSTRILKYFTAEGNKNPAPHFLSKFPRSEFG